MAHSSFVYGRAIGLVQLTCNAGRNRQPGKGNQAGKKAGEGEYMKGRREGGVVQRG